MPKTIFSEENARKVMMSGIDQVANPVGDTLGPNGRTVIIHPPGRMFPFVTKDGVTVANNIDLDDEMENASAMLVIEVAKKTAKVSGDGTTTATVLLQTMVKRGFKLLNNGHNPVELKKGMEWAIKKVVAALGEMAIPINTGEESIMQIATVSANNDEELGAIIAKAYNKVGKDGKVLFEEGRDEKTDVDMTDGFVIDRGLLSVYFCTNMERMIAEFKDAFILVCDSKISNFGQILHLAKAIVATGSKDLLIIAESIEPQAMKEFVINKENGQINIACIHPPSFGQGRDQYLSDICTITGAKLISENMGSKLTDSVIEWLGRCDKAVMSKDETVITGGKGKKEKIDELRNQIKNIIEDSKNDYEKEQQSIRLAKLDSSIAIIKVGGQTETEMKEKKDRVEDAVKATRAALEEGIVPGGGTALIRCIDCLKDDSALSTEQKLGAGIIRESLEVPLHRICINSGIISPELTIMSVKGQKGHVGYNAKNDEIEDLRKSGIIDPKKVSRVAIENAGSMAIMILLSNYLIVHKDKSPFMGQQ